MVSDLRSRLGATLVGAWVGAAAVGPALAQDTGLSFDDLDEFEAGDPITEPSPVDGGDPSSDGVDIEPVAMDLGEMSFDLELNSVLVATFEVAQTFLEPEAERVRRLVEDALGEAYVVQTMADVPAFADYDAEVYLRSCPQGQYIGCVFVVGGRAKTDWTIGGSLVAVEGGYKANLSFIDVEDARLVLEFDVVLDGSNDVEFQEGVQRIMSALVADEVRSLDLRGDPAAARAAERDAEERRRREREFAAKSLYEDPDDLERGEVGMDAYVEGRAPKSRSGGRLTNRDLDAMEDAGGLTPWERAGLTRGQYRLYRNSGVKLRDFKDRLKGRKGQILIRAAGQLGNGPFVQEHDSFLALRPGADPNAFGPDDVLGELVALRQGSTLGAGGMLELGVGATPWLEIDAFVALRGAPYRSRFFVQVPNREQNLLDVDETSALTWNFGLRIGFAPGPAWRARPTLHLGASYWAGTRLSGVVEGVPDFYTALQTRPNNMILAHIQPGFEVDLGRVVQIFGRVDLDLPLMGRSAQFFQIGDADAVKPVPQRGGTPGLGLGGTVGLAFRIRPGG